MADFVFKIIVVGQAGVGKTSIVRRFIRKSFPENDRPTIGVDIGIKLIEIDGVKIQVGTHMGKLILEFCRELRTY